MTFPDFKQLKKNIKKDYSDCRIVRLALLGDTATQLLVQAISGYGYISGVKFEIFEADYNQIERQILDPSSDLYKFKADFVWIFNSSQRLLSHFNKTPLHQRSMFAENIIESTENMYDVLQSRFPCKVIYCNYLSINDNIYGHYAQQTEISFEFQLHLLNSKLMSLANKKSNIFLLDIAGIQVELGRDKFFDPKMYINADMVLSFDALPLVAKALCDII